MNMEKMRVATPWIALLFLLQNYLWMLNRSSSVPASYKKKMFATYDQGVATDMMNGKTTSNYYIWFIRLSSLILLGISEFCSNDIGNAFPPFVIPTAREVSVGVTGSEEIFNPYGASELTMHFGQFVDHDLVHVPTEEGEYDILLLVNRA